MPIAVRLLTLNEFDLNKENSSKKSYSFVDKKITLCTRHHNSLKLSILLPVRANLLCNLQCETPCSRAPKTKFGFIFKLIKTICPSKRWKKFRKI